MTEAMIKGLGLGMILALSVGPVIFTILKQSINHGHRGGFSFIAGVWISDLFLVVISNMFTELVRQMMRFSAVIGYVGSAFLIGMGVYYAFFKKVRLKSEIFDQIPVFSTTDVARTALSGFFINTLNPSVIFFWLINATAFAASHSIWERVVIFSVCLGLNMVADVLKVLMAGRIRDKLTAGTIGIINKVSGTILIVFGISLLYAVIFRGDKFN
jgi:threonine/homoserine/homoserine lactone efflux protein